MDRSTELEMDLRPPTLKRPKPTSTVQESSNAARLFPPAKPPFPNSSGYLTRDKAEFPVTSLDDFYKQCPTYRLPVELGAFSLDDNGKVKHDRSQLRYYVLPAHPTRPNFDLNIGFAQYSSTNKNVPSSKLDPILKWVSSHGNCFRPRAQPLSPTESLKSQNSVGNGGAAESTPPLSPADR